MARIKESARLPLTKKELDLVLSFRSPIEASLVLNIGKETIKRIRREKENALVTWETKLWLRTSAGFSRSNYLERYLRRISRFPFSKSVFQRLHLMAQLVDQYGTAFNVTNRTFSQGKLDQPRIEFQMLDDAIRKSRKMLKKLYNACPEFRERVFSGTALPEQFEKHGVEDDDDPVI